jgi:DNA replicative helicase MCM subunit Mcm2 (Cdc46/Mcm family)
MTVMNINLQKQTLEKLIRKRYGNQNVDVDQLVSQAIDMLDSSLHFDENLRNIEMQLGIELTNESEEKRLRRFQELDEEFYRDEVDKWLDGLDELEQNNQHEIKSIDEDIKREMNGHRAQLDQLFYELVRKTDPLTHFSKYICPELAGYEDVKKAVLLMLATDYDHTPSQRDRIHIFLAGKPGTGKTVMMEWLERVVGAKYLTQDTTTASLKADARRKDLGEQIFTKIDGGIVCFDEIALMKDRDTLRDVMEEGAFKIAKAGREEQFPARCRIVAGTNEAERISQALISRFDFFFEFQEPSKDESKEIAKKITRIQAGLLKSETDILKEFLLWAKEHIPRVPEHEVETIDRVFDTYFELKSKGKVGRWIASVYRVAKAYARLHKRDVETEDIVVALQLKDPELSEQQVKYLRAVARGMV